MWGFLILFALLIYALLNEKAKDNREVKEYNNGICPKCGKRMSTLIDEWGNDIGFGCTNCSHRASDRYIGSDFPHLRKDK